MSFFWVKVGGEYSIPIEAYGIPDPPKTSFDGVCTWITPKEAPGTCWYPNTQCIGIFAYIYRYNSTKNVGNYTGWPHIECLGIWHFRKTCWFKNDYILDVICCYDSGGKCFMNIGLWITIVRFCWRVHGKVCDISFFRERSSHILQWTLWNISNTGVPNQNGQKG